MLSSLWILKWQLVRPFCLWIFPTQLWEYPQPCIKVFYDSYFMSAFPLSPFLWWYYIWSGKLNSESNCFCHWKFHYTTVPSWYIFGENVVTVNFASFPFRPVRTDRIRESLRLVYMYMIQYIKCNSFESGVLHTIPMDTLDSGLEYLCIQGTKLRCFIISGP